MFINLDHFQVIFGHFVFILGILDSFKKKYVGVQSWKAAHLPTLEIRVEQKGIGSWKKTQACQTISKKIDNFFLSILRILSP